jgi:DNA invertase Pin-like site-specific DNA recombinase
MNGQRVGYVRVSALDQHMARQLEGMEVDRVFEDHASGKDTDRPGLMRLLEFVREGDTVLVHSMDRLARNVDDLRRLVRDMTDRKIQVQFVKESLVFTGADTPMANLLLNLLGAVAEFERALIRERQREGIALARAEGVYKGRKPALTDDQQEGLKERVAAKESRAALAREFGISRSTLYKYLHLPDDTDSVGNQPPPPC